MLEGHVYALAAEQASPAQARALQQLRDEGKEQLSHSQSHLARWDKRAVEADWAGYCRASRAMRASMRRRIKAEQEILYPLLEGAMANARPHRSRV